MTTKIEPRPFPVQMWDELSKADEIASTQISQQLAYMRAEVVRIGAKYGFTAQELIDRGILTPPRQPQPPKPGSRKGARAR